MGPKDLFAERNSSRIKSAYDIDHESRVNQIFVYVSRLILKPLSRACKIGNHESQITKNLSQLLKENIAAIALYANEV